MITQIHNSLHSSIFHFTSCFCFCFLVLSFCLPISSCTVSSSIFLCYLSSCQHFCALFLSFFSNSSSVFVSLFFVTSSFVTFSLSFIAYFHFFKFLLRMHSCVYRFKNFPRPLFHRTQEYTRRSEVLRISL